MDALVALTPMAVVAAAFVAIVVAVKRLAEREAAAERAADDPATGAGTTPPGRTPAPGSRVHVVPVDLGGDAADERETRPDGGAGPGPG